MEACFQVFQAHSEVFLQEMEDLGTWLGNETKHACSSCLGSVYIVIYIHKYLL